MPPARPLRIVAVAAAKLIIARESQARSLVQAWSEALRFYVGNRELSGRVMLILSLVDPDPKRTSVRLSSLVGGALLPDAQSRPHSSSYSPMAGGIFEPRRKRSFATASAGSGHLRRKKLRLIGSGRQIDPFERRSLHRPGFRPRILLVRGHNREKVWPAG
jgi:hypothetical protein